MEVMISIIIPSVNDPYLQKTIDDIREKAETDIEIIVVLDEVEAKVSKARVFKNEKRLGLRGTVNQGVKHSRGDYLLKVDEHCKFGQGFDRILLEDIQDNWIVIPRRYNLDVEKWEVMDDEPIDYDRLAIRPDKLGGVRWTQRAEKRKDILVDETMVFQGSCYFMSRKHWDWLGGLQEEGYGPFANEAVELALKTWLGGGKVMVNKKTWYAHKHRKFGRVIAPSGKGVRKGNSYSRDFWLKNKWAERKHDFNWLMKRFGL
jgi:glycosyltransferase involved in cell wall biosynthesis